LLKIVKHVCESERIAKYFGEDQMRKTIFNKFGMENPALLCLQKASKVAALVFNQNVLIFHERIYRAVAICGNTQLTIVILRSRRLFAMDNRSFCEHWLNSFSNHCLKASTCTASVKKQAEHEQRQIIC